ncbi:MAG: recombinase RecA [Candidatus Bathyarchaeota archaeon]|nr:MAG: recombinase RecA [Candidatus Bathyarchaeota archaeon]
MDILRPRVTSGIHGLDELIGGGFEKGKTYLVSGETGTCKTIFSLQLLLYGILQGEPGIYVTVDQNSDHIVEDAASLDWDLKNYIDMEDFIFLDATPQFKNEQDEFSFTEFFSELKSYVDILEGKRIVLDPIVPLAARFDRYIVVREYIRRIIGLLETYDCTTIITTEIPPGSKQLSMLGVEELFVHGVIVLGLQRRGNRYTRTLLIRKMRGTPIDLTYQTFSIRPGEGIVITGPLIDE